MAKTPISSKILTEASGRGDADWGDKPETVTYGDVLQAVAKESGDMPVTPSDARAIHSAEARALEDAAPRRGLAAQAQAAAARNIESGAVVPTTEGYLGREENSVKIGEVLQDAKEKLQGDHIVTNDEAAAVWNAEARGEPTGTPHAGGVAALVVEAARKNEGISE